MQPQKNKVAAGETAVTKKLRRALASSDDPLIVLFVSVFTFYFYSLHDFFLGIIAAAFFGSFTLLLLKSAHPYRIRSVFVVILTVLMWIGFALFLAELGPYIYSWIQVHQKVPLIPSSVSDAGFVSILCPYLLPFSAIGQVTVKLPPYVSFFAVFPPTLMTFATVVAVYLITALVLGKGFCGWLCPFGGLSEGFRHVRRSGQAYSRLKGWVYSFGQARGVDLSATKAQHAMRDVKYAALLVTLLLALTFGVQWFCVFCWAGLLSWFGSLLSIFIAAAIASFFFIGLPLISGKKWCHSFCPVGAGLSLLDRVSPFRIVINNEKCTDCDACIAVCPTFAFVKSSRIAVGDTCDKCLVCVGKCPFGATELKMRNLKVEPKKLLIPAATLSASFWFLWFIVVDFDFAKLLVGLFH
jgi:ferredoxin-type protein NapH